MEKLTRRDVLKGALATTGALLLANMPGWKKPAVQVGAVPAFAQTSLGTADLRVVLTWDTGVVELPEFKREGPVDLDLHVYEPDGTHIYWGHKTGLTGSLDVDNMLGFGPETVMVPPGQAASGRYDVLVNLASGSTFPTTATIDVTSFENTAHQQHKTYTFVFDQEPLPQAPTTTFPYICSIDFQSGNIYVIPAKVTYPQPPAKK